MHPLACTSSYYYSIQGSLGEELSEMRLLLTSRPASTQLNLGQESFAWSVPTKKMLTCACDRAMLIGSYVNMMLYALEIHRVYFYYKSKRSRSDSWFVKLIVAAAAVVDTVSTLGSSGSFLYVRYHYLRSRKNYLNVECLQVSVIRWGRTMRNGW